jgi:hypothetical protein
MIGEQYGTSIDRAAEASSASSFQTNCKNLSIPPAPPKETRCLHIVSKLYPSRRKDILSHPLVQLFVQKKARKFQWVIWMSLLFHVISLLIKSEVNIDKLKCNSIKYGNPRFTQLTWIGLYMWHAVATYYNCCELGHIRNSVGERMYCSKFPFQDDDPKLSAKWSEGISVSDFVVQLTLSNF